MTTLYNAMKSTNKIILDNNEYKLYVNRMNKDDMFEYILAVKSTNCFVEKGIMNYDELNQISKKYFMCYLDGYAFDIIDDCYL